VHVSDFVKYLNKQVTELALETQASVKLSLFSCFIRSLIAW
jgi:hypothetical protein